MKAVLAESQSSGIDERLTNVQPHKAAWLLEQKGGRWGRYGWYLAAREQGVLRIALPGFSRGILKIRLWDFSPGRLSVSVRSSLSQETLIQELNGQITDVQVREPTELVVLATSTQAKEQIVFDRFAAAWFNEGSRLPSVLPVAASILLGLIGWALRISTKADKWHAWTVWLGCAGIIVAASIGFYLRLSLFDLNRGLPADPDAVSYFQYAQDFQWFSSGHGFYSATFNEREPGHVAALSLWLRLWGQQIAAMKFYTVCLSSLLILICGLFIWMLSGRWYLGVCGSIVVAVSSAWIDEAVRGLRLESISLMLLAVLTAWLRSRGWLGAILLGILIGCLALIQSTALGILLPLIWLGWIINIYRVRHGYPLVSPSHWQARHLTIASVIAVLLLVPHLYGLYKTHGNPSWPSYRYARWNANVEFPERIGTAGFPSAAEMQDNLYAGPEMTYGQYLFSLHSISDLLYGQLKGWAESIIYMSVSPTPHLKSLISLQQASGLSALVRHMSAVTLLIGGFFLLFTGFGWLDLWHRAEYWWVPFFSLWGIWYAAFLYSVRVIEPFRHTAHVYPLLLFCFLWGVFQVVQRLLNITVKT